MKTQTFARTLHFSADEEYTTTQPRDCFFSYTEPEEISEEKERGGEREIGVA